jgi:hypothetical protein
MPKKKFKRDGAPANAKIKSAAAELIEHTNLLECSQGMVQIQQHHQRSESQPSGALCYGGQEQIG